MSRETYFEFGSIGKTFTAVLLLQLHEQGVVDLDAPVTRYLPWFEVDPSTGRSRSTTCSRTRAAS